MLHLKATAPETVSVGRLGRLKVTPATYLYVGSACGPGGVRARVRRHARRAGKRLHWHVDYLRAETDLAAVWYAYGTVRRECQWAQVLHAMPQTQVAMDGFGASDCACAAHLFATPSAPSHAAFQAGMHRLDPSASPIHTRVLDGAYE